MNGIRWRSIDGRAPNGPTITVNGRALRTVAGETVATALLREGFDHFGPHPKTGRPLAPFCLMGVCFGCLCTIDGRPGSQACLEPVREGLVVETDA